MVELMALVGVRGRSILDAGSTVDVGLVACGN
jgi:hypothetical protein